jgi:outer membrane protein assembly factor BamB
MNDDFVTRLQFQLREAAERESRRGLVARAAAAARWRVVSRPVLVGAMLACALAITVAATLSALRHTSPPVEQAVPPGHPLELVASGKLVTQGGAITPGFGAVWASDPDTGELLRIDPRSRRVLARVSMGGEAFPDAGAGAVWATADGRLIRIDPASNRVSARIPLGLGARAVAVVSAGRDVVWVASPLELLRIDPRHNTIDRRIGLERQSFQAHGFATDQKLLYLLRADRALLVLDAATGARVSSTRLAFDGFLMGAADGTILLAAGTDVVAVDARSGRTLWRTNMGAERVNDGFLANGSLWIHSTNSDTNRDRLLRLDARNGHPTGSFTLPEFGVAGIAAVGDDIWIVSPNGRLMVVR